MSTLRFRCDPITHPFFVSLYQCLRSTKVFLQRHVEIAYLKSQNLHRIDFKDAAGAVSPRRLKRLRLFQGSLPLPLYRTPRTSPNACNFTFLVRLSAGYLPPRRTFAGRSLPGSDAPDPLPPGLFEGTLPPYDVAGIDWSSSSMRVCVGALGSNPEFRDSFEAAFVFSARVEVLSFSGSLEANSFYVCEVDAPL